MLFCSIQDLPNGRPLLGLFPIYQKINYLPDFMGDEIMFLFLKYKKKNDCSIYYCESETVDFLI